MKDQVLEGFVENFSDRRGLSKLSDSEQFEAFAITTILRKHHQVNTTDLDEILTGGGQDGGLDSIVILVNGHIVSAEEDIDFFVDKLRRLEVEFVFAQAKTSAAFEAASIGSFVYGVEQFFSETPTIPFSDHIEELRKVKDYIYRRSIEMENNPTCHLYYATAGRWDGAPEPSSRLSGSIDTLSSLRLFSSITAEPMDAERLKTIYRELERGITKEVEFSKNTVFPAIEGVDEAYLGLLKGSEFIKMISTEEGSLNRNLFYDNVRDFQGINSVNKEIAGTLANDEARNRFALLNNGVTIVARNINRTGDSFKIQDFQIVNGCQTSHILFQNKGLVGEDSLIPVKLVSTQDSNLIAEVIKATNRQTAVLPEALESLTPFHKELEDYYLLRQQDIPKDNRIFYERRSKQYAFQNIPPINVVSLTTQTKSFVGMFLNEPHSQHRYYGELLKSYQARLFVQDHKPAPYYVSGFLSSRLDRLFGAGQLDRKWRPFRFHILMLMRIQIGGASCPAFSSHKITPYSERILELLVQDKKLKEACDNAVSVIATALSEFPSTGRERNPPNRLRAFSQRLIELATPSEASSPETESQVPQLGTELQGKIHWYDDLKNFGFIECEGFEDNIFFHRSGFASVPWHLRNAGTKVKFKLAMGSKGLKAENIKVVNS